MLEKVVADLLTKVLGDFIHGLTSESLQIAMWGGKVVLQNLQVKKEAVDNLDLPFSLARGVLGKLEVIIPWKTLFSEATIIRLSDLHILLRPRAEEKKYNQEEIEAKEQKRKQQRLKTLEKLKLDHRKKLLADPDAKPTKDSEGVSTKLLTRILENLEIYIDHVHLRMEDPEHSFSAGMTLKAVVACPQNEIVQIGDITHKLMSIQEIGFYWNDKIRVHINTENDEAFKNEMRTMINHQNLLAASDYVVKPISTSAAIQWKRKNTENYEIPNKLINVIFEVLQVNVNEVQLRQIFQWKERTELYRVRKKYRMYRPVIHTPATDPIRYWKFVIQAHLEPIRRKRGMLNPLWLSERRSKRLAYMKLWKTKLLSPKALDTSKLEEMERGLSYEDIVYFRSLVEAGMRPEELVKGQKQSQSWWSWGTSFLGTSVNEEELNQQIIEEEVKLSKEEREIFLDILQEAEEDAHKANNLPPTYVTSKTQITLNKIQFTLSGSIHHDKFPILEGCLLGLNIEMLSLPASSVTRVELHSFEFVDHYTPGTLYPIIAKPICNPAQDFFALIFEKNPQSSPNDYHLEIDINASDLIIQPQLISRVSSVFSSLRSNSPQKLEKRIEKHVQSLKRVTRIQALHVLDTHKKFHVNIHARGPRIILIHDPRNPNSTMLVLDTGKLSIRSEAPAVGDMKDSRMQDHLYDRFQIRVSSLQARLYSERSSEVPFYPVYHNELGYSLIEEVQVTLILGLLMCPPSEDLTKVRISGYSSDITANINANGANQLVELLYGLITGLQDPSAPATVPEGNSLSIDDFEEDEEENHSVNEYVDTERIKESEVFNERFLDCHFSLGQCSLHVLSLDKIISPIVVLSIQGLAFQMMIRAFDIQSLLEVRSVSITDCKQPNGYRFRYLVISEDISISPSLEDSSAPPVLRLALDIIRNKDTKIYRGVDVLLDISIHKLFVTWNRESIVYILQSIESLALYQWIVGTRESLIIAAHPAEDNLVIPVNTGIELEEEFFDAQTFRDKPKNEISPAIKKIPIPTRTPNDTSTQPIQFRLVLSLDELTLAFNQNGAVLASICAQGFYLGLDILKSHLLLRSCLNQINILSRSPVERDILKSDEAQKLFMFQYKRYSEKYDDYPGWKQKISLHINPMYVILVPQFIVDFMLYFDEMKAQRELLKQTSDPPKLPGTTNPKRGAIEPTKESQFHHMTMFEICVRSPMLIIPQNSISSHMIQLCLGVISIHNEQIDDSGDFPLLMKKTFISIASSNVKTGVLPDKLRDTIVTDVSFRGEITDVYHDATELLPKKKIYGEFHPVLIHLTERTFTDLVNVAAQISKEFSLRFQQRAARLGKKAQTQKRIDAPTSTNEKRVPAADLIADIIVPEVKIELFDTDLRTKELTSHLTAELNMLKLSMKQREDKCLYFSVGGFSVYDSIPHSPNEYKHLISFQKDESSLCASLRLSEENEIKVNVVVMHPALCVIPDLVYYLKEFFTTPQLQVELTPSLMDTISHVESDTDALARLEESKPPEATALASPIPTSSTKKSPIFVDVSIIDFYVALPVDTSKAKSYGIVAKSNMILSYHTSPSPSTHHITAFADHLQVSSCQLHDEENTLSRIIKPNSFLIKVEQNTELLDIKVIIDPLFVTLSYRDIKFFMVIGNHLAPKKTKKTKKASESDLFHSSKTTKTKQKLESSIHHVTEKQAHQELSLTVGGACITLVDDHSGSNIPLANIRVHGASSNIQDWSSSFQSKIEFKFQADYYNRTKSFWEPLVEPWRSSFTWTKSEVAHSSPVVYNNNIAFTSHDILQLNVTKTCIDTLLTTAKIWGTDLSQNKSVVDYHREPSTILLYNDTGMSIGFHIDGNQRKMKILEHGHVVTLLKDDQLHSLDREEEEVQQVHAHTITVTLDPEQQYSQWKPIEHLPLHRTGSWMVSLHLTDDEKNAIDLDHTERIEWNVELKKQNQRVITIRSDVSLRNNCSLDLEVLVIHKESAYEVTTVVSKGEFFSIPLAVSHKAEIFIRPRNQAEWCEVGFACDTDSKSSVIQCPPLPGGKKAWFFQVQRKSRHKRKTVTISPPITLENLLPIPLRVSFFSNHGVVASVQKRLSWFGTSSQTNDAPSSCLLQQSLERGEIVEFYAAKNYEMVQIQFLIDAFEESSAYPIELNPGQEFPVLDSKGRTLIIYMASVMTPEDHCSCSVFSRYWLLNKTSLPILFREKGATDIAAGQVVDEIEQQNTLAHENLQEKLQKDYEEEFNPLMYSYSTSGSFLRKNKTSVKIADSEWSLPISLESVGTDGFIVVKESRGSMQYEIGVAIELLTGRFFRTKIISFTPRYILINNTTHDLYYRQSETQTGYFLRMNSHVPFHWADSSKPLELCITRGTDYNWSACFCISQISEFILKIPAKTSKKRWRTSVNSFHYRNAMLVNIEVQLTHGSFLVICKEETLEEPPYRIENSTRCTVQCHQKYLDDLSMPLPPYGQVPYLFDIPDITQHVIVVQIPEYNYQQEFNLDKIQRYPKHTLTKSTNIKHSHHTEPQNLPEKLSLVGEVIAEGPTRILRLIDPDVHPLDDTENPIEVIDTSSREISFQLNLQGIGVSVIDDHPQEILYMTITKIFTEISKSTRDLHIESRIYDIQVDNQLPYATYPVLASRSTRVDDSKDLFHLSIVKSNFYRSISFFHYFSFLIQEMDIRLDDIIINHLVGFSNLKLNASHDPKFNTMNHRLSIEPKKSSSKIYFALLHINACKFNLTFTYSSYPRHQKRAIRRSGTNVVQKISSAIGITLANVDNAPISLNALILENAFHKTSEMIRRISKHYGRQLIIGVYNIIGSFDIIGNPVSLVHNLGTGVRDFKQEIMKVQSPREFKSSLQKGSSSLVKNSMIGVAGTASNIFRSIGKGAAQLSMDPDYVQSRNMMARENPSHFSQGVLWGTQELFHGIYAGVAGVFTQSFHGAREDGVTGGVFGMGRGIIGLAVKPTIGVADLATRTSQGVINSARKGEKVYSRVRPPRGFGPERLLMVYSLDKAIGHSILCSLDERPVNEEWHLFHCLSGTLEQILLVSNKKLYIVEISRQDILFCSPLILIDIETVVVTGSLLSFSFWKNMKSYREKSPQNTHEIELYSNEAAEWASARLKRTLFIIREFNQDEQSNSLSFSAQSYQLE